MSRYYVLPDFGQYYVKDRSTDITLGVYATYTQAALRCEMENAKWNPETRVLTRP